MTIKTIGAVAVVKEYGKPFYASEVGLNGGLISALAYHRFIKPTGNTKFFMIDVGDGYYKEVETMEWEFVPSALKTAIKNAKRQYANAKDNYEKLNAMA